MFKRDALYYENRIQLLSSKDAQANRALINKCMRKLRKLNMEGSDAKCLDECQQSIEQQN